ncbi:MAG: hypothetical protein E7394_01775 [Ruminococcaceae bacterium]|nr:hypothetical protein [Oscillospiraceae bacterium]
MNILKKALLIILTIAIIIISFLTVSASETTHQAIRNIIDNKQHKLVFASIVNVHGDEVTVYVTEEIGSYTKENTKHNEDDPIYPSVEGEEIEIEGLKSYMYFDGYDYHPKKGDNVLLSLTFNGNVYSIKNGAFLVTSASHDNFLFKVPEGVEETDGAIELTALYKFVSSDGRNSDFTVRDSVLYTHDTDGEKVIIEDPSGIEYMGEDGKIIQTENTDTDEQDELIGDSYKWIIAFVLIFIGVISGFFVSKIINNFEKRSEQK